MTPKLTPNFDHDQKLPRIWGIKFKLVNCDFYSFWNFSKSFAAKATVNSKKDNTVKRTANQGVMFTMNSLTELKVMKIIARTKEIIELIALLSPKTFVFAITA